MSPNLAASIMSAPSAEDFYRLRGGSLDWRSVADLKHEVDQLLGTNLNAASRLSERIQRLASILKDPLSLAFADVARARILYAGGCHSDANLLYERAIKAIRQAGQDIEAAKIQIQQIDTLKYLGRYHDAFAAAKSARKDLSQAGAVFLAQLETNLGNVYFHLDRYRQALTHYDKARALLAKSGDETMRALVDYCRSCVFIETDQPDRALALMHSVADAYERAGKVLVGTQIRCQIAYIQFQRGNYNMALAGYYAAGDQLARLGSQQDRAFYEMEIAEILLALNSFEESGRKAAKAAAAFGDLAMSYEKAKSLQLAGLSSMGLGDFVRAESDLLTARDHFESSGNRVFRALTDSFLAELALRMSDSNEAASRARSSLQVFRQRKLASRIGEARLQAARAAYLSSDLGAALRMVRLALRSVEPIFCPGVAYKSHHLTGRIMRDRGKPQRALESFRKAVAIAERMRGGISADDFKATFLADKLSVYEDAAGLCLDLGGNRHLEEAFRLIELCRSRVLSDLLSRYLRGAVPSSKSSTVARRKLSKLIEHVNWLSAKAALDESTTRRSDKAGGRKSRGLARQERTITQLFRRVAAEEGQSWMAPSAPSITTAALRGLLGARETVVEFFAVQGEISAFVASREAFHAVRAVAPARRVEQIAAALRFQLEKFSYQTEYLATHLGQIRKVTDTYLSELYRLILGPLAPHIDADQLTVIPYGPLHYVPFQAMLDGNVRVLDRYEISYAPSAEVMALCRRHRRRSRAKELLALGVPDSNAPQIEEELRALGGVFPDSARFFGEAATRGNLLRNIKRARFLHIASHGTFRRDNPMFSSIRLADAPLNFYSLLDLKIGAELVTLSACKTGVNVVFPGDELHGLARGFLYAGVPALVVSLWSVNDSSTAKLMAEMYSRIRDGQSKRSALRGAQLAVRTHYPDPYYWAPFVLIGDPS